MLENELNYHTCPNMPSEYRVTRQYNRSWPVLGPFGSIIVWTVDYQSYTSLVREKELRYCPFCGIELKEEELDKRDAREV